MHLLSTLFSMRSLSQTLLCVQSIHGWDAVQRVKFLSTSGAPQALCPVSWYTLFPKKLVKKSRATRGFEAET